MVSLAGSTAQTGWGSALSNPAINNERSFSSDSSACARSLANANPTLFQPCPQAQDKHQTQSLRASPWHQTRRVWLRSTPRINHTWTTLRNKIDHGVDFTLSCVDKALKLKPSTVEKYRMGSAKALCFLGKIASVTSVALWAASFAFPPAKLGIFPAAMTALSTSVVGGAIGRSMAHQVLNQPTSEKPSLNELIKISNYMRITKQPFVRVLNTPMTRTQLLITIFKEVADQIKLEEGKPNQNSAKLAYLNRINIGVGKQLHTTLHSRAQDYNRQQRRLGSNQISLNEVDPNTLWRPIRFNIDELTPTYIRPNPNNSGPKTKDVIDYLQSDLYSEYRTRKPVVNLIEKLVVRPNISTNDFTDLLRLINQTERKSGQPITVKDLLNPEDYNKLAKRGIGLEQIQHLLSLDAQDILLRSINSLSLSQVENLISDSPTDGKALKIEAAFRDHIFNHPDLYGFSERGNALTLELRKHDFEDLFYRIQAKSE